MEVSQAIEKRVSIRKWKSTPVEKEKIEKVLWAGWRAPSWGNVQPWRFIVVQNKDTIAKLAEAAGGQDTVGKAPVVIACCCVTEDFSRKLQRQSLKSVIEFGALDWTDDFLDNVVLESDMFAPYLLGEQAMTIKAGEQIMIAIAYMTIEAVNQGLGTCWVGAMSGSECRKVLNLPDKLFVHDLLPLGYPDQDPAPRPRKPIKEIAYWEKYE
jgi:nitroreductase